MKKKQITVTVTKTWCTTGVYSRPHLFLIYINDLQVISDVLGPVIFTDDTNLVYSQKDINALFFNFLYTK